MDEVLRVPAIMMAGILHSHGEGFVFPSLGLSFFLGNHVLGRYATLLPKNYIPWNCFEWLRVLSANLLRTLGGSTSFWEPMVAWLPAWRPKPGSLHCFYFLHFFPSSNWDDYPQQMKVLFCFLMVTHDSWVWSAHCLSIHGPRLRESVAVVLKIKGWVKQVQPAHTLQHKNM